MEVVWTNSIGYGKVNRYDNRHNLPMTLGELEGIIYRAEQDGVAGLYLNNCNITILPESIGKLNHLKVLSLTNNKLIKLPHAICNLTSLCELHLSENKLISLPENIDQLTELKRLFLDNNQLNSLPKNIECLRLWELNLRNNQLETLPDFMYAHPEAFCTALSLDNNPLTDLSRLARSPELLLSGMRLTSLPESIGNLPNLELLHLCYNNLTTLPKSIGNLTNLAYLSLDTNQLTNLPNSISKFTNLTDLYLDDNPLIGLSILQDIPKLKYVHCFGVNLPRRYWTKLSEWKSEWILDEDNAEVRNILIERLGVEKIIERARLDRSSSLFLNRRELESLPDSIGSITNLTALHLENNRLSRLPESICSLTNLTSLYLFCSGLTNLPNSIGLLANLTHLDLNGNQLTELPVSICNLSKLNHLTIWENRLTELPEKIGNLTNLTYLDLHSNQITKLPRSVSSLFRLTELNLNHNPLIDLSMLQFLPNLRAVKFLNVYLPRRYWAKFSDWKPQWLFDEENTEIRRILVECVGYGKICQDLGAVTLDTWREYTLLKIDGIEKVYIEIGFDDRVELIGTDPMVLIKMICPSTGHIHILRVPPEMKRVQSAITWINHGIHPDKIAFAT